MPVIDIVILVVILVSLLVGAFRGFFRETLSLVSWVLAFWVAFAFAEFGAQYFEPYISNPSLRVMASFVSLFVLTLLITTLISYLIHKLFFVSGLSGIDRVLGALFGIARGIALVAVVVLFARLTAFPKESWWLESTLLGHFVPVAEMIRELLPDNLANRLVAETPVQVQS